MPEEVVTGARNQLVTDGTWKYYYDREGNLIRKVDENVIERDDF